MQRHTDCPDENKFKDKKFHFLIDNFWNP